MSRPTTRAGFVTGVVFVLGGLILGDSARAEAQPAETQPAASITYDHFASDGDRVYEVDVSHGQTISVLIQRTCSAVFGYTVRGVLRAEPDPERTTVSAGAQLDAKTITIPHDDQFGGYILSITRTSTAETEACGPDTVQLEDRTLVISTRKMEWDLAFSGGFTVSNLTNPQYFLRDHPTVAGRKQVQEAEDARDAAQLGIGTFVHLYHRRVPYLGGVFGLGIREGNATEYFLGGGLRFNDKATLNVGVAFGPIKRLPNGVNITDPVEDGNVLNELPTRVKRGVFVGITYSFLNVRDRLEKPFASGETPAPETPSQPQAEPEPGGTCNVTLEPASVEVSAAAQEATVQVKPADATCDWKPAGPEPAWAVLSTPKGSTGAHPIVLTIEANPGPPRAHELIKIGNQTLVIKQAAK